MISHKLQVARGWQYLPLRHGSVFLLLVTCYLSLTSCGFHLRSAVELPPAMARTLIAGAENSPLYYELESALLAAGGEVVGSMEEASAILTIHADRFGRRVLSVDTAGRASEYEISLFIDYSLGTPEGEPLAQRDTVTLLRDYRFDPDNVLASVSQEAALQGEMRRYAVRQILRRLQSLSRAAPPAGEPAPAE